MSHQIRLRAAWECKTGAETKRIDLPDQQSHLAVTYVRSFNAPTSIDQDTPIRFVLEAWNGRLSLFLDEELLIADDSFQGEPLEVKLSGRIVAFHRFTLVISADSGSYADQSSHAEQGSNARATARLIGPCYLLLD